MNAAFTNLKTRIGHWRQWELNPVIVKELRQAVRSWAVTGMLILFLAVLFCASLLFLVTHNLDGNVNQRLGANVFQTFYAILAVASMLFIPLYVGIRMAIERQESNLDLLYTSTLTPGSIVRGKFLSGAYTTLLFFSACGPFMAFTNLLRGVDLPSIFLLMLFLYVVVCSAIMLAIFLACLPASRAFKVVIALGGLVALQFIVFPMVFMSWRMMSAGLGSMLAARSFWSGFTTIAVVVLMVFGLLYFLSVALISPPSANRALPLRTFLTLLWLLGSGFAFYGTFHLKTTEPMVTWAVIVFIAMVLALLVVVSNSDQLSLRVRRRIPAGGIKRGFAFLFFNGAAGGLLWAALLLLTSLAGTAGVLELTPPVYRHMGMGEAKDFIQVSGIIIAYALAYTLTGLFIHRKFFSKRPPKLAGLFAMMIAAGMALLPNIALFFVNRLSWKSLEKLQLGNVFNLFIMREKGDRTAHLVFALAWVAVMLVLNAKWFFTQARNFRRLEPVASAAKDASGSSQVPPILPPSSAPS